MGPRSVVAALLALAPALELAQHFRARLGLALGALLGRRVILALPLAIERCPLELARLLQVIHVFAGGVDEVEPLPQFHLQLANLGRRTIARRPHARLEIALEET